MLVKEAQLWAARNLLSLMEQFCKNRFDFVGNEYHNQERIQILGGRVCRHVSYTSFPAFCAPHVTYVVLSHIRTIDEGYI